MEKFLQKQRGPMYPVIRDQAKNIFLTTLAETNRIGLASQAAGISRITAWHWRNSGYVTDEELLAARSTFEELLALSWSMGHFGQRSRYRDPLDHVSGRRLRSLAKSHLPEWGGRPLHTVQYSTAGWTPSEKADIYNRIRAIQAKHPHY